MISEDNRKDKSVHLVVSPKNISLILAMYGLKALSYRLADSGIENCTVLVETLSGKYVLRIYRQHKKSDEAIQCEIEFTGYLAKNDIPVPELVANLEGGFLSHLDKDGYTWQAILMHSMPGRHAEHYSDKLVDNLATLQATMHNLAASYKPNAVLSSHLTELRETHFQDRALLDARQQSLLDRAEKYVVKLDDNLSRGLCHMDFDNGNVLSEGDEVTAVLDFDDLALAPYVVCLAYTLWDIAFDRGLDGAKSYIESYEKTRVLSAHEKSLIRPIMLFRHYAIGCQDMADGPMDELTFTKYIELENELKSTF